MMLFHLSLGTRSSMTSVAQPLLSGTEKIATITCSQSNTVLYLTASAAKNSNSLFQEDRRSSPIPPPPHPLLKEAREDLWSLERCLPSPLFFFLYFRRNSSTHVVLHLEHLYCTFSSRIQARFKSSLQTLHRIIRFESPAQSDT